MTPRLDAQGLGMEGVFTVRAFECSDGVVVLVVLRYLSIVVGGYIHVTVDVKFDTTFEIPGTQIA
jgi:hypothetical protein